MAADWNADRPVLLTNWDPREWFTQPPARLREGTIPALSQYQASPDYPQARPVGTTGSINPPLPTDPPFGLRAPGAQWCIHHGFCRHSTAECKGIPRKVASDSSQSQGPSSGTEPSRPGPQKQRRCLYCNSDGHPSNKCPKISDQRHRLCFNCAKKGHMVGDCGEPFNKELIDANYTRYLQCLKNKTPFQPVQNDQVQLQICSDTPLGPTMIGNLYKKIPLPSQMKTNGTSVVFEFTTQAAAMTAFHALQNDGLQLQILGTIMGQDSKSSGTAHVPVHSIVDDSPSMNHKYKTLEDRLSQLESTVTSNARSQMDSLLLLQHIATKLGLGSPASDSTSVTTTTWDKPSAELHPDDLKRPGEPLPDARPGKALCPDHGDTMEQ